MPEITLTLKLPNGEEHRCYSPSSVVRQYFQSGEILSNLQFLEKAETALTEASQRVKQKFGFHCSAAAASLEELQSCCQRFGPEDEIEIISL